MYHILNINALHDCKAAWRNGIASDYDNVGDQEIAGSTPAVVIFVLDDFCNLEIFAAR